MRSIFLIVVLVLCLTNIASPQAAAQSDAPIATGLAVWVRAPGGAIQDLFSSAAGAPQFAIGYRGNRYGLGFGVGFTAVRISDEDSFADSRSKQESTLTMFQLGPSGWLDIWHSEDDRTRAHLAATVSIGRFSVSEKDEFSFGGQPAQVNESEANGTLIGIRIGIGGEHFLHEHFALGFEAGFQGIFVRDIEDDVSSNQSISLGANGAYSALRLMLVF